MPDGVGGTSSKRMPTGYTAAMEGASFLQDLSIVLLIAGLVTVLFHYLKQPIVLGYILAGFIIGPHTPPFPLVNDPDSIQTLSQLGIVMLMFSLGLQLSFRGLMKIGPTASVAAVLEILLMIWIGYQVGRLFGWEQLDSIFLGAILLSSSTVIIVKALNDLGLAQAKFARFIFGILVIDDMAAIIAIALLSGIALSGQLSPVELFVTGGRLGLFFTAVLVVGLLVVPRLLRFVANFKNDEILLVVVLGMGFGMAMLALQLGFSTALGAFLLGAVIAETQQGGKIRAITAPVRDMFSAVFFVSIGLLVDPSLVLAYWVPILFITVVLITGKTLTGALGAFIAGNDTRTSLRVGLGLAQIGEFAFIIAVLGRDLGVTSDFLYPIAVSVSAITTLTTPFLIKHSDAIAGGLERLAPRKVYDYLHFYTGWVVSLSESRRQGNQVRVLLRRWFLQMGLNMVLVAAIFISISALSARLTPYLEFLPAWAEMDAVLFLMALLLALPLLVATLRKLRAAGMLMSEAAITGTRPREQTAMLRSVVISTVLGGGAVVLTLFILLIGSAILPSWPVLLVLAGLGIAVAIWQWRSFVRIYSRAQGSLRDTLGAMPEPESEDTTPIPTLLRQATIDTVTLPEQSPAVGRLIRELQLRSVTGASIVGIEREDESIVNPSPDEDLQAGDRVLLLGSHEHLKAGRAFLVGDDEVPAGR
ncbi:cation:proton antiporter [Phycisphaerales bacterium AB-hyl4]|uniref:Cation:proton antiporter n=1 Tax=Natronomicrosphaera hydrolytica TaxID=3242702 RepID=A0ABV4U7X6_9BACT